MKALVTAVVLAAALPSSVTALAQTGERDQVICRGPLRVSTQVHLGTRRVDLGNYRNYLVGYHTATMSIEFQRANEPGGFGQNLRDGQCSFVSKVMTAADGNRIMRPAKDEDEVSITQSIVSSTESGDSRTINVHLVGDQIGTNYARGKLILLKVIKAGGVTTWSIDHSRSDAIKVIQ